MKRILFVLPFLSSGGAERVVSIWSSEMAKKGVDVHLLLFYRVSNEYNLNNKVKVHTISTSKTSYDKLSKYNKIKHLRNAFKEIKPDVILPFISYVGIVTSIANIGLPYSIVETVRIDPRYSPSSKINRFLRDLSINSAEKCIVQSKNQLDYFSVRMQKKMVIHPNPIDNNFIKAKKVFTENKVKNIVSVGRLEKQKNFPLLIKSFSEVAKKNKDITLRIYGVGSLHSELQQYISSLDMEGRVLLCGRTNNIVKVLQESDLFILSSDAEGMPNSLMEAMAIGLPCISTDCPSGPSDLIQHGINGLLVPVNDSTALIKSIETVISNVRDSIKMGENAKLTILDKHAADNSSSNLINFLESM